MQPVNDAVTVPHAEAVVQPLLDEVTVPHGEGEKDCELQVEAVMELDGVADCVLDAQPLVDPEKEALSVGDCDAVPHAVYVPDNVPLSEGELLCVLQPEAE